MFKTISAGLLAASVLVAPALAAPYKTTAQAPAIKSAHYSAKVLNANARWGRHHHRHHFHHRHHRHHHWR